MLPEKLRREIAKDLHEAFKFHQHDDLYCAICGKKGGKLALGAIKYSQDKNEPLPKFFVPQSESGGRLRGCFPVCDKCCPICKKCGLPIIHTDKVYSFLTQKKEELKENYKFLMIYAGVCHDIQWHLFFKDLIKFIIRKILKFFKLKK